MNNVIIEKLKDDLHRSIKSLEKLEKSVEPNRTLGSMKEDYNPIFFQHSHWECEESPTSFCMYTNYEFDSCIFCYSPDERK